MDLTGSNLSGGAPLDMGRAILDALRATKEDFYLVSENGTPFGCHKLALCATKCEFFVTKLNGPWKECAKSNECKLECSDKSVRILRDFLYGGSLSEVESDVGVALELLEQAEMMAYNDLGRAIKNLILRKQDKWLTLDEALFLFDKTVKWGKRYEDLQKRAVKTITLYPEEVRRANTQQLFGNDLKTAKELICALSFLYHPRSTDWAVPFPFPDPGENDGTIHNGEDEAVANNSREIEDDQE